MDSCSLRNGIVGTGALTSLIRPSDLTVLAVERDFDVNYERVIDKFSSNHKD